MDGIEEDRVGEARGGGGWAVGGGSYSFLEEGPGETEGLLAWCLTGIGDMYRTRRHRYRLRR